MTKDRVIPDILYRESIFMFVRPIYPLAFMMRENLRGDWIPAYSNCENDDGDGTVVMSIG